MDGKLLADIYTELHCADFATFVKNQYPLKENKAFIASAQKGGLINYLCMKTGTKLSDFTAIRASLANKASLS